MFRFLKVRFLRVSWETNNVLDFSNCGDHHAGWAVELPDKHHTQADHDHEVISCSCFFFFFISEYRIKYSYLQICLLHHLCNCWNVNLERTWPDALRHHYAYSYWEVSKMHVKICV